MKGGRMMSEQHGQDGEGTWLTPDQAALVVRPNGAFSLIMPELPDDEPPSQSLQLLVAMAVRVDDPEWVAEMLEFLHAQRAAASQGQ
jgi:hypothetical protein